MAPARGCAGRGPASGAIRSRASRRPLRPGDGLGLLLALLLFGCAGCAAAGGAAAGRTAGEPEQAGAAAPAVRHLLVLHLNDVADLDRGATGGGLARAAAVVHRARAGVARVLVTGGGDLLGPSPAALLLDAEPAAEAWRALGLDVATPGDRDLGLGPATLGRRIGDSGARWTTANLRRAGRPDLPCCGAEGPLLLELNGLRVGVAGVTGEAAAALAQPERLDIEVLDPVVVARDAVAALRARGADVVLLLAHGEAPLLELLARAAQPDLVLGGHAGSPLGFEAGPALVVRTSPGGQDVARIDLLVREGVGIVGRSLRFLPVGPEVAPDPGLAGLLEALPGRLEAAAAAVAGVTSVPLDPRPEALGAAESPLGNLLADLARARLGADAALIDAGSIAGLPPLEAGPLPAGFALRLLPDLGRLALLEVTGAELRATLEHGLTRLPEPSSRFLQLSGLRVTWDPEAPPGRRLRAVTVDGAPLDARRRYRVAVTARLARGSDGHAWLRGARRLVPDDAGPLLADLLLARLRSGAPLAPALEGRVAAGEPRGVAEVPPEPVID